MKAIEYYNKYARAIMAEFDEEPQDHRALQSFLNAFSVESINIMKSRKPKHDRTVVAVFKQQNKKWNDICRLIERHYSCTPIKRNAYWNIMKNNIAGLAEADLALSAPAEAVI